MGTLTDLGCPLTDVCSVYELPPSACGISFDHCDH